MSLMLSSSLKKIIGSRNEEKTTGQTNVRKRFLNLSDCEVSSELEPTFGSSPAKQRKVGSNSCVSFTNANQTSVGQHFADWVTWMVETASRNYFINSIINIFSTSDHTETIEEDMPLTDFSDAVKRNQPSQDKCFDIEKTSGSAWKNEELKRAPLRMLNDKPKQLKKLVQLSSSSEPTFQSDSSKRESKRVTKTIPLCKSNLSSRKALESGEKNEEQNGHQKPQFFQKLPGKAVRHRSGSSFKTEEKWLSLTAQMSIRLQEREQYRMLLQQYTSEPMFHQAATWHTSPTLQDVAVQSDLANGDVCKPYHPPAFQKEKLDVVTAGHLIHTLQNTNEKKQVHLSVKRQDQSITDMCQPQNLFSKTQTSINRSKHSEENLQRENTIDQSTSLKEDASDNSVIITSFVHSPQRNQSTRSQFKSSPFFSPKWHKELKCSFMDKSKEREQIFLTKEKEIQILQKQREADSAVWEEKLRKRLEQTHIAVISEKYEEEEEDISTDFPVLTEEMERLADDALEPTPPDEVLVEGFRLSIRRRDMETLSGLSWLNDEVINFYMNQLMERGKLDSYPSVYAFNTFFYPKLAVGGHSALRRWTRKIDIFSYDLLLVPVHLGMHWCLAVVDFTDKKIKYYDSMGGQNSECLKALRTYLQEESLDKKKKEFDMSDWSLEIVKDIPHQMNGSDCGMFACKYAEYVTRRAKINFTQAHMPYFRRRMVYEILTKKLL
ncbi:sentrin-specific protease 1-like [Limulus polyphemus]|uniref:Sentrin-specific protease 1-like n=1 Tax=Limulus polyphemus TaxID=6850 RepID=A0ABM1C5Z0_LIMPO|nr:sentrin-specific protease 1-like [Limulus polyphemus]